MADATVTLGLNAAQLSTGLKRATSDVEGFSKRAKSSFSGAFSGGMMSGFLGAAGIGGLKSVMSHYDDLADAAIRLGESAETIQRVEFATKQLASVDMEGLVSSFLKLEKAMGDAGNEDAVAALEKFGVTAESLSTMSLDEKILALRDAFGQAKATGNGYNAMLDLFGRSAGNLIPIFEASREQIVGLMNDANAMSDSAVNSIAAMNDEMDGFLANTYAGAGALIAMFGGVKKAVGAFMGGATPTDAFYEGFGSGEADAAAMKRVDERKQKAVARAAAADAVEAEAITKRQKTNTYDVAKNLEEQANAAKLILDPYRQFLDYLDEARRKQELITKAAQDAHKATQSRVQSQKDAALSFEDELRLAKIRETGKADEIKQVEREIELKNKSLEIQRALGVTANVATQAARDILEPGWRSEDKAAKAGKIMGYSSERQGTAGDKWWEADFNRADGYRIREERNKKTKEKRAGAYSRGFSGLDDYNNFGDGMAKYGIGPNVRTPLIDASGLKPVESSVKIDPNAELRRLYTLIETRLTVD